ncbi:uncharacterized protein LAJ45_05687 [Morchella importuna]|uniref:Uncharacterized protein n=1 Tax=Morchella conica CCBAS932 TaxID=1392247 RepID=A0A3N4KI74_9PEZI|nr:uncharacterized protein LAJ45_05687 [Morchella importuna]KAH8150474.1 hypothetical protein LAJ45_05687 [Morchella importuna]RPB08071.1 hypothetical protein P167DRAFT_539587 [Morchella conica CCBAS932]
MCIRITERYAVCKCTYFTHGIDQCQSVGRQGHNIQEKTVLVGYACQHHSPNHGPHGPPARIGILPDLVSSSSSSSSGYSYQ